MPQIEIITKKLEILGPAVERIARFVGLPTPLGRHRALLHPGRWGDGLAIGRIA